MSTSPSGGAAARPAWKPLDARQRRVLGVLVEKAKTTPAGYPMSVNAIVAGCNQKNNREPLAAYDDIDVEKALDELRNLGAVSEIDWLGRVSKYKHHAYEWLGVNRPEAAVMTELLLRGAQALGELRARAARMEPIEDLTALKPIVEALVERGLMIELTPPGRGQVVSHNLYTAPELAELRASLAGHGASSGASADRASSPAPADAMRPAGGIATAPIASGLAALAAEVGELRAEVDRLRERVSELEAAARRSPDGSA